MAPLPAWAYMNGAVVGLEGGTDTVNATLQKLIAADVPLAALWIQDWSGVRSNPLAKMVWYNWVLDEQQYPRWAELVAACVNRLAPRRPRRNVGVSGHRVGPVRCVYGSHFAYHPGARLACPSASLPPPPPRPGRACCGGPPNDIRQPVPK